MTYWTSNGSEQTEASRDIHAQDDQEAWRREQEEQGVDKCHVTTCNRVNL